MKSNKSIVFLLFLASFLLCTAELENVSKKRGDIAQKSNSNEETDEEVAVEDMENTFEQLRELKALRDTILKLVPSDPLINEKIDKHRKDDTESKTETVSKETLENSGTKNVWMKTMIAQTKDVDSLGISGKQLDDEDIEITWEDHEQYEALEEEIQEPLSPEQQTGESKLEYILFLIFLTHNVTFYNNPFIIQ